MPSGGIKMNDKVNFLQKIKKIAFSKKASKKKNHDLRTRNANKKLQ